MFPSSHGSGGKVRMFWALTLMSLLFFVYTSLFAINLSRSRSDDAMQLVVARYGHCNIFFVVNFILF